MKSEVVPRKCSTCIRKGKCKDQKRFEVSPTGRCSRQHVSRRAIEFEVARLKIAHLRRMADSASIDAAWSRFCDGRRRSRDSMQRAWDRLKRFESACLAKITELKESQCSTNS